MSGDTRAPGRSPKGSLPTGAKTQEIGQKNSRAHPFRGAGGTLPGGGLSSGKKKEPVG